MKKLPNLYYPKELIGKKGLKWNYSYYDGSNLENVKKEVISVNGQYFIDYYGGLRVWWPLEDANKIQK